MSGILPPLTPDQSSAAGVFLAAAEAYCHVLDSHHGYRPAAFVRNAHRALAGLYHAALDLPDVAPETDRSGIERVGTDAEGDLARALAVAMAPYHVHWFVFDPCEEEPEEPVASYLPHDLAEIYRDVRNTCAAWIVAGSRRDALWAMRFQFTTHWGRHAVHAMAAMHCLLYDK